MLDPQRELLALVDNFVADLSAIVKRFALEQIKAAFGIGVKVASPPPLSSSSASSSSSGPERASRARRGQREIEALRGKLLAAIAERPGRRAEDINTTLGTKTPQIAQLLRRLVADQLVRTEGARRGTRYFATAPGDMQSGRRADSVTVEEPAP
jgi:hypothetical protein